MSLDILIAEYPGDQSWARFISVFQDGPQGIRLDITENIARVLGADASAWLVRPIPALDGRTPRELLADHPQGEIAVRSVLMRMPR